MFSCLIEVLSFLCSNVYVTVFINKMLLMKKRQRSWQNQKIPYLNQIEGVTSNAISVNSSEILLKLLGLFKMFLREIVVTL